MELIALLEPIQQSKRLVSVLIFAHEYSVIAPPGIHIQPTI